MRDMPALEVRCGMPQNSDIRAIPSICETLDIHAM
jgi:hypothetical protein